MVGAYYLAGYAVECGLKSCILAYLPSDPGIIFRDKKYSDKCWTHNLEDLVEYAGLEEELNKNFVSDPDFDQYWSSVRDWAEITRYRQSTEFDARRLFVAINDRSSGVLQWVKRHW